MLSNENKTCDVAGCEKPARSRVAAYCPMHYHREYRHGSVDKVSTNSGISASLGRRYKTVSAKDHPIAPPSGRIYEHRKVLYDAIGGGIHPCHWCQSPLVWGPKGEPTSIEPDHLNGDGADNRLENLVPSCRSCNVTRGIQARSIALQAQGWWSKNDTIEQGRTQKRKPSIQ